MKKIIMVVIIYLKDIHFYLQRYKKDQKAFIANCINETKRTFYRPNLELSKALVQRVTCIMYLEKGSYQINRNLPFGTNYSEW